MFDKLKALLRRPAERPVRIGRHLAMAVLLVETARADFDDHVDERELMRDLLVSAFGLEGDAAGTLLDEAFAHAHDAVSLHEFLRVLNSELDADGKLELIEGLWRVAWADGRLDPLEEARIRQLSELLFVPHRDFVRLRLKVEHEHASGD